MTQRIDPRLIAIGDIHGCVHALDAILDVIQPCQNDTLVVLGDFIDQGRDSRDVIDRLVELDQACHLIRLKGNHEEMMLAALEGDQARRYWENAGGVSTIYSYRFGGTIDDIPEDHVQFVRDCQDYHESDRHIFVHANFDPKLPMPAQPIHTLRWAMLEPDEAKCHQSGKTVICGHSEQNEVLDLGCIQCIDTACWQYGWLTALDVLHGQVWQASRFGILRSADQKPVGPIGSRRRIPG